MGAVELSAVRVQAPAAREFFKVIVIGAGQAGLSVGYHLAKRGIPFVILDANARVGDVWRKRWDSLRLFTPAQFDGLDGMPFPAPAGTFPTKEQMADYLSAYAKRFNLPVRLNTKVDGVSYEGNRYVVSAGAAKFEADHVVVAMANYQHASTPSFASDLDSSIVQLHAGDYHNPRQLRDGPVLVVGSGNSGAEIALELASTRKTWLAGDPVGEVPFKIQSFLGRHIQSRLVLRFAFHRLLTTATPFGRKMRGSHRPAPLIRTREGDLAAAGVQRTGKMAGVRLGRPLLADGRTLNVSSIVWCTGFQPDFSWIRLPVFDETGAPAHVRGVVEASPGLYFLGLNFLYAYSSTMIHGVGRDARYIAEAIKQRVAV